DEPDLVRRFVAASIEGWRSYLDGDPAPAEKLIKADNPDMSDALLAYGRKAMKDNKIVTSGDGAAGAMEDARWKAFFDVMAADGLYPKTMDYKAAYTAAFLPKAGK
ncbi:MAG: ABC transporter substrate-binding protein, partial [Rhodospirillaceae bacterium]|nr:ABC transporter substrate-binding protein [Rhodospirillaceae bacterium]